jgi:putative ABC transport system substrate-binding protein
MRRREAILAVLALAVSPQRAIGQQPGKIWRIGFLGGVPTPDGTVLPPLRQALQALGYAEGKNVVYEGRWSRARSERLPALVAELLGQKLDLIVVQGAPSAAAAKQASRVIPIITIGGGDLVETGLVTSLARPGGNITGVSDPATTLSAKRLEILKEVVPGAKRIAVLWNADDNAMTLRFRQIERAAQVLRVNIEPLGVREPDDFDDALAAMNRSRPDALIMVADALTNLNRQRVFDYAANNRIPAMYEQGAAVEAGGLMSYGAGADDTIKLAAEYIDKVLKGAKPGELPVQQPNRYYLVVNLKTAKTLGIAIPQAVLLRADQVIE